jgi:glycerol-3-phosphate acyltransferase PlsY
MLGLVAWIVAYLLGAIPVGYLLVKVSTGKDVRTSGSRNIGATNVLRTTNPVLGLATLILDIAKGFLAVWIAATLTGGSPFWTSTAALAVIAGHAYPVFLGFKGGKAVASFIGGFLYLTPIPLLASLIVFVAVAVKTRYISAGSIIAAGSFPIGVWLIAHPPGDVLLAAFLAAAFIIYRHKANLERIRTGSEYVFKWNS